LIVFLPVNRAPPRDAVDGVRIADACKSVKTRPPCPQRFAKGASLSCRGKWPI
jgi:hypothetical protein